MRGQADRRHRRDERLLVEEVRRVIRVVLAVQSHCHVSNAAERCLYKAFDRLGVDPLCLNNNHRLLLLRRHLELAKHSEVRVDLGQIVGPAVALSGISARPCLQHSLTSSSAVSTAAVREPLHCKHYCGGRTAAPLLTTSRKLNSAGTEAAEAKQ